MKKRWNTYFKRLAIVSLSLSVFANSEMMVAATEVTETAGEGIQTYGFWEDLFGKPEEELETIGYVDIYREHLPEAVVGESFTDTEIALELYEDATYSAVGHWEDENGNRSGVFEEKKVYYFKYTITAFEGYCFDLERDYDICDDDSYTMIDNTHIEAIHSENLAVKINEIELFNAPTAEIGEAIPEGFLSLDTAEDANYAAHAYWYDYKTNEVVEGGVFEEGKGYVLVIHVIPLEGYQFDEDPSVKVDGVLRTFYGDSMCLTEEFNYLFYNPITTIEVSGVKEPVVGEKPSVEGIHIGNSDQYTVLEVSWAEEYLEETDFEVFEDNKTYLLNITVQANEGYNMGEYLTAIVDGQEIDNILYDDFNARIVVEYTFKDYIAEIYLTGVPEFRVGEEIPEEVEILASEDANYYGYGYWLQWDEEFLWYSFPSEVFEAGKSYLLSVGAEINEGYYVDADTKVYLDGVICEKTDYGSNYVSIDIPFRGETEIIDTVYVTVQEPVIGNDVDFYPEVSTDKDANYNGDQAIHSWIEGSLDNYNHTSGVFTEDKDYGVKMSLYANEGYTFADDLTVIVNGKIIPKEAIESKFSRYNILDFVYFFNMECEHVYTDDADASCDVCGEEREITESKPDEPETDQPETNEPETNVPETNESETDQPETNKPSTEKPETGDHFELGVWCAIFGLSMVVVAVMGVIIQEKNKRR